MDVLQYDLLFSCYLYNVRRRIIAVLMMCTASIAVQAQLPMFDQTKVNRIFITMPTDSLQAMYNTLNSVYYMCSFVYTNGIDSNRVDSVGIRFRGNTSLASGKKSIKLAIDKYAEDKEFKGLRKLNLIGNHNDPTYVREKLFYHCWEKAGFAPRRISFVEVYINNINYGICSNVEEVDKQWLQRVYNNDSGNLYKCSWGADLKFQGNNPSTYKSFMTGGSRTYDLQTNESNDTYIDLTEFIKTVNGPNDSHYLTYLDTIFDYKNYLKALALDVYTGNWDNYAYNANNYLLWHDSVEGKFKFITFDTDNTFGVDWSGIDWTMRDPYKWYNQTDYRALCYRLLNTTAGTQLFSQYLDSIGTYVVNKDTLFPYLDSLQAMLAPFVPADSFKTLDYGYDSLAFAKGFVGTVDAHTPYGIKPFIEKRRLFVFPLIAENQTAKRQTLLYPNPSRGILHIANASEYFIYSMAGNIVASGQCKDKHTLTIDFLVAGNYTVHLKTVDGASEQHRLMLLD
jgi:hypothetical protein